MALTVSNVTNIPKFGKSEYSRRECPSPPSFLIWLSRESPILAADFIHQFRRAWFPEMEPDSISSQKAECSTAPCQPLRATVLWWCGGEEKLCRDFGAWWSKCSTLPCSLGDLLRLWWPEKGCNCCSYLGGFIWPPLNFHPLLWNLISKLHTWSSSVVV